MVRPKAHVAASRKNGAVGAKNKTLKRVLVLEDGCEPGEALDGTFTAVYRLKPKKGYFYEDELADEGTEAQEAREGRRLQIQALMGALGPTLPVCGSCTAVLCQT